MKAILCDDDALFLKTFEEKIKAMAKESNLTISVIAFSAAEELLENADAILQEDAVFFVDIDMPTSSGFDLATALRNKKRDCPIVFVSQKDEFVFKSFDYQPLYFLRKAYLNDELKERLIALYNRVHPQVHWITAKSGTTEVRLTVESICMVEADLNYIKLYRGNDSEETVPRLRMTISGAYEQWKDYGMLMVHKGFLVNARYIVKLTRKYVELSNGRQIRVGRAHIDGLRKALLSGVQDE